MKAIVERAVEIIRQKSNNFIPKVGIILGSGLGPLADEIENAIRISYSEIPEFPVSTVQGHSGTLVLGSLGGVPVACLKGRVHLYENPQFSKVQLIIRSLKSLGCDILLMTNAAGSLNEDVGPGEISILTDHMNFQGTNPLVGPNDEYFGPRFPATNDIYSADLRELFKTTAETIGVKLHEGVYLATLGPTFETPAEIKAYKILGADLVGMSIVPEALVATHCGFKIAAISVIVNYAAGMVETPPSHEETLHFAEVAGENLGTLFKKFLEVNCEEFTK